MTKEESGVIHCGLPVKAAIFELQLRIHAIENDGALYEEKNFDHRIDVIDFIGFQVIEQIEELLRKTTQPHNLNLLKDRAEKLKSALEEIDINLFQRLRENIREKNCIGKEFNNLIHEWFGFNLYHKERLEEPGYDNLDILINGLFPIQTIPEPTKDLEPDMVYYQKTPARIVFELAGKSLFKKEDVFFDLGSGLGQPVILINLLTGVTAKGVEFEPAYCQYARDNARELNLSNVEFINADARNADYSEGTAFFMFTPFKGQILQEVLAILRKESLLRKIKIFTYGPCTGQVALQSWLFDEAPEDDPDYKLGVFSSL